LTIIISERLCNICDECFLKDPFCLGDYTEDGVLLQFCEICGQMVPYLYQDPNYDGNISRNQKKLLNRRVAKRNKLDYKKVNTIEKELKAVHNKEDYVEQLSNRINKEFNIETDKNEIIDML